MQRRQEGMHDGVEVLVAMVGSVTRRTPCHSWPAVAWCRRQYTVTGTPDRPDRAPAARRRSRSRRSSPESRGCRGWRRHADVDGPDSNGAPVSGPDRSPAASGTPWSIAMLATRISRPVSPGARSTSTPSPGHSPASCTAATGSVSAVRIKPSRRSSRAWASRSWADKIAAAGRPR